MAKLLLSWDKNKDGMIDLDEVRPVFWVKAVCLALLHQSV